MAKKPENVFRGGVHRHIPAGALYHMKTNNPYLAGPPDDWYSGRRADLWVEYKWIPTITPAQCLRPALTALQQQWINGRYEEGRSVWVIVGCKDGGVIHRDQEWDTPTSVDEFRRRIITRAEIAKHILDYTT